MIDYDDSSIPVDSEGYYIYPEAKDLPKTHFPADDGWILVRDCKNLPLHGTKILFIVDSRGTQDEFIRDMMKWPTIDQEVRSGIVWDTGFEESLQEYWLEACSYRTPNGSPVGLNSADSITYWRPLPEPPKDTFIRSPYNYHQVYEICMKSLVESGS